MRIKALFFSLLIFSKVVLSQTGTVGSPFTSLYQARTVTTPGTYYFNLGGTTFNTHVAADGWLLVAIDFVGAPAGNLPQVNSLTTATRAILTPSVLSSLNEIKRVKISTSNGTTNAVTTNTTIVSRVKNNQTLNSVIADNALLGAGTWVGTGAGNLNGLIGCNSTGPLGLHAQIIHGACNGGLLHWQPNGGYRSSPDYFTIPPSGTSFNLWVQAADMPGGINGEIWYKANADVTLATGVSLWKDQTHNAINLTQPTAAKQPVINNTGALMINFNPSIAFDGTDDVINTSSVISTSLTIGGSSPNYSSSHFIVYRSPNSTDGVLYNQSNGAGGMWNIGMMKSKGLVDNRFIGSATVSSNVVNLQSIIGNVNSTGSFNVNGSVNATSWSSIAGTPVNNSFWVGAQGTNAFTASQIAEIIVYPSDLSTTATNKQRIESYLGLKYGISLPFNYVASDNSTVFWNTTTAASYSNNIAGIGKDAISGLEQKQSQSQNTGNQVIFGLGTVVASNAVNTNTFAADKQFMAWGDNNLTNGAMFVESADPTINYKINRVWFTQNTNSFNQAVQLLVPATLFGAASSVSKVIINKLNSSFPNDGSNIIVSPISTTTVNSVIYYAFNLTASQVSSNFYFTLAKTCSPIDAVSIVSTPTAICAGSTATISATSGATNGLLFNGTSTHLRTPNIISGQMPTNDVTVELWFKPTAAGVIMNEIGLSAGWQDTQIEVSITGEVKVRVWPLTAVSLGTVTLNTWNHVALRYSTAGTKLDGVLNGVPSSSSTIGVRNKSGAEAYYFGHTGSTNLGTNAYFNGSMDEIRIWKVARTDAEILANMYKTVPVSSASLVAYYQFNESSGSTTADATSASNNGTIINGIGFLIPSTAPINTNTYVWSTSATTASIAVSPSVTTTYSVQISDAVNCQTTQTVNVTVNALPSITAVVNPTVICAGSPSTLTASGASTYSWTSGPTTSTNTVNTAGTYTVLGTDGNGCVNTQTVSLLANASPTLTVNSGSICSGDSFTITPSGASTYTYSGGSNIVSPFITTNYTVVGSNTAGCVSSTTLSVEVNKKPNTVITGTNTICIGNSATLSTQFLGSAIGGVVTYSAGYAIHTFTSNGTFSITGNLPVEYLIVAGGGGGGYRHGAGGGGGGLLTGSLSATAASFPIVVGAGGAGGSGALPDGRNGSNTSALSFTATGGGGGGSNDGPTPGNGGSGGGAPQGRTPGTGIVGQGFNGGAGSANNYNHGGGGGAGGAGVAGTNTQSGNGGPGLLSNISGSAIYYAGGGGGGDHNTPSLLQALGGIGGGGNGGVPGFDNPGFNGAANTGGGGGGAATFTGGGSKGGDGGSGIVIIRYLLSNTGGEPSSYLWSTGATTSSITVTPTVTTTYSVVATSSAGCVGNTSVFTVSVNALPVVTAAANPTTICGAGTSTLTAGGASTYTWTSGPSTSTNTTTSAGTYTVTGTNGNGCVNTQTVSLVVNALPTLTVSNGTICVGDSFTITPSGASTYAYSGGSSVVSPTTSTNYTVTGTDANSCVNTATLSLTVNALPVVTAVANPTAICVGGTSTLTAGGASTYVWTSGPITSTNTVSTAGTYTVTGTNGNGCVNTQTVSLSVNALPVVTAVANPTAICAGGTSILTAGGASTYVWTSGPSTSTNTVSTAGTYTVTGTNGNGCVNTQTVNLVVNALPVVTAVANPTAICVGSTSTLTAGGASTYVWTSGPSTSTNTASTAGTYTVTGTNGNGCVNTQTVSLVVNALPIVTAVANPTAICVGGTSTLTAGGASTYVWTSGPSTSTNTVNTAGTYTVTGTNSNGCVNTQTVSLVVNALPLVTAVANPTAICVGGTSTLTAGGASTYVWTSGPSTSTNTGSTAGTYTVTGTNGNGCVNTQTVSLVVNALPVVTAVANPTAICVGATSTLTAGGASTYVWTSGPSTSTNTASTAGTYTVTGTNGNGCVNTKTVSLVVNALPVVTAVANPTAICVGGTSTLTAGGASTYVWTGGPSTSTNTVNTAGTYTVTGTNGNGCVNTQTVSLVVNALPVVTAVANPTAICVGGTSTLTAGGASTYVWTSGPSTSTNTVNTAGTYTVTGTNSNGCVNTQTVSLVVNALPLVTAVANPTAICVGGTSTLTAGGASSYVWTGGPSTSTNTVNTAGTYTVTGTNGNGCVNTQTVSLVVNALPVVTAVANPTAICVGGTSTLTAGGASTYVWTSGPSTSTNTVSTAGTYTVTGTNGNGCVNTKTVSLVVNALPVVTAVANPTAICVGGTSTLTAGGASTYVWTSGPSTSTNTASTAGTYTVTGTNGNGCVNTKTVSLVVNALPVVTAVANPTAICVGGTSTLTAGGASTYVWTSGPSTSTNTVNTAGTYTVTGTNGNGCVNTQTVSLAVNSNPTLVLGTVKNITCLGSSTGSISTLASGGASGYSYAWTSAVSSTNTATGLLAGVYTTTVTDANGCKATLTNTVAAPSTSLSASIATSTTGCGFANGTASLTATGGWNTGYTYQWQSSASTTTLGSGYAAGTYTTNVTDANGCSIVKAFTISNPTTPTVNVVASSSVICSGQTTTLTPSGAVSYTLASPSTTFTSNVAVSPITTTVYNISGTDASNCVSGLKSITVTVNTTPTVALSASSASICLGNTATVTPSGANTYTLVNTGASITTNAIVNPSSTTVYTVTGRSAAGCVSSPTVITVAVNSNPTLTSGTVINVSCLGSSTGSISTVASGGASGYSYVWTSAVSSTNTATGLLAGVYTTTVTDVNGCKATLTNTVAAPSTSLSASVATSTTGCGLSNGTATVTAAGGWNPGYTYQWQSSVSTTTLGSGYAAGTYTTNVTDANGCSIVKTFTISNPTTPTVNIVASSSVICSGQTTTLTTSGAVSYTLTSPSTTFTSNVAVSPITTTVYNISGSDASNCVSGIKSITITVNTTPTVALSASSTSICLGNTATVTPSGANTYTLINTGASITTNTVVSPSSTTVYTVTGTSIAGCLSTPSAITVAVNSNPTLTLSTSNATICNGNSITLTALGTDTYTWTSGPNTPNYVVSPSSATVYTVVGTNTLTGCVSSISTTTISVNPTPVLTVSATALSVCSNGTVNLNVNGATTYTWSGTGIFGSNVNSSNPIFAAPSSNTYVYSVIGTNTVSCPSAANTITITIIGSPNSSLVASSQNICEGGNATFSIVPQPGVTYNWLSPSVLSNTTGVYLVPSTISNVAGNYSINVVAILGTGSNTCSTSSTGNLVVFATPTISLSQNSISVCDGEAVSMNVNNPLPSPANYNWSYNNTNGTFITIPQISLNESGTYTVTVTDVNGCENSSTVQILVKSCGYEIPVLLTPNDDGKNDAFVIKNIQLYPNCKVQIFNRWGSAIYSKVGYQNDWKGTFDLGNGGKLPAATYFILIEFNDGETKPYQGYIQIEY